ncbi:hypothetical protein [Streptomyces sp. CA-111067]|uniref:hypothetical protein n=1 Tax=Streptomyces sp. CA-111067 TaxID=3240046 RepID=UPI003D999CEB
MQTRTKKTLATTALGLAFAAAAAGTASAAESALPLPALGPATANTMIGGLPVGTAGKLLPGTTDSAQGAQQALSNGTSALPAGAGKLLPSGNEVGPVNSLLGGLPVGG